MGFHLAAWSENVNNAGTLQTITAVPDDQLFTAGDDIRVPTGLANMLAAWAYGRLSLRTRIVAPSLRAFANYEIVPANPVAVTDGAAVARFVTMARNPIPLAPGESVNFESTAGGAAAAHDVTGLILLGDGPVQPVSAQIRTVQATAAIAGTQRRWVSGALTFAEDLPAGQYQVVGARCQMDAQCAFRLIFVAGGPRPGSVAVDTPDDGDVPGQRMGGWGVWGQFDTNQPPQLECLSVGAATSSQRVFLDLIRV